MSLKYYFAILSIAFSPLFASDDGGVEVSSIKTPTQFNAAFVNLTQAIDENNPYDMRTLGLIDLTTQNQILYVSEIKSDQNTDFEQFLQNGRATCCYAFIPNCLYKIFEIPEKWSTLAKLLQIKFNLRNFKGPDQKLAARINRLNPILTAELELICFRNFDDARLKYQNIIKDKSPYAAIAYLRIFELETSFWRIFFKMKSIPVLDSSSFEEKAAVLENLSLSLDAAKQIIKYRIATSRMNSFGRIRSSDGKVFYDINKAEKALVSLGDDITFNIIARCHRAEIKLADFTQTMPTAEYLDQAMGLVAEAMEIADADLAAKLVAEKECFPSIILRRLYTLGYSLDPATKTYLINGLLDVKSYFLLYNIYKGDIVPEDANPDLADNYLRLGADTAGVNESACQVILARQLYQNGDTAGAILLLKHAAKTEMFASFLLARYYGHPNSSGYDIVQALPYFENLRLEQYYDWLVPLISKYYLSTGQQGKMQELYEEIIIYAAQFRLKLAPRDFTRSIVPKAAAPLQIITEEEDEAEELTDYIYQPYQIPVADAEIDHHPIALFWPEAVETLFSKLVQTGIMKPGEVMALAIGLKCAVEPSEDPAKIWIKAPNGQQQFLFHNHFADNVSFKSKHSYWKKLKRMLQDVYIAG